MELSIGKILVVEVGLVIAVITVSEILRHMISLRHILYFHRARAVPELYKYFCRNFHMPTLIQRVGIRKFFSLGPSLTQLRSLYEVCYRNRDMISTEWRRRTIQALKEAPDPLSFFGVLVDGLPLDPEVERVAHEIVSSTIDRKFLEVAEQTTLLSDRIKSLASRRLDAMTARIAAD